MVFAAAALAPVIGRVAGGRAGWLMASVPLVAFVYLVSVAGKVWHGETWRGKISWAPQLGIDWDLWISPLGLLLGLLVTGIGTLVTIYAGGYLAKDPGRGRFLGILFLFMGAMLGLSLSENLIVFFLFWELTSISSYLLIGYYHSNPESRKSALDALLVTAAGGVALLAGIILLGQIGGSYLIGDLVAGQAALVSHALYPAAFFCVFVGAATKSAQFPFHFWLPGAMAAPAPVSSYLHSATMVKAGVFLLAIMHPILGGTPLWHHTLLVAGAVTMTWAALVAVVQTDLKRLLAYTTVSALGTLVMLLGVESASAAKAAMIFLIVHAFYKGALFMVAGIVEKTTGTREVTELRGLVRSMPLLAIAAGLAAFSMSGLPPFIGFIAKELIYELKLEDPVIGWPLLCCGVLANAANIVVALKVGVAPFRKGDGEATPLKMKPGAALCLGPLVLGVSGLVFGLFPGPILDVPLAAIVSQIRMEPFTSKLALWHGINPAFLLSLVTVAIGLAGFAFRRRLWPLRAFFTDRLGWNGQASFRAGLAGFIRLADRLTRVVQSGSLRNYFIITMVVALCVIVAAFIESGYTLAGLSVAPFRFDVAIVLALIAASTIGTLCSRHRMTAILLLGCTGFGIAGLFALYGAPDLAITQILVETLTLVLFGLAITGLPVLKSAPRPKGSRLVTVLVSVAVGITFTLLTLKSLDLDFHEPIANEIARLSLPEGYGRNVVNVILVDFRAMDTLGEIVVLAIAAFGVAAMLERPRPGFSAWGRSEPSAVLLASARYTAPAMVAFSIYLLLRGHNLPGGGFIGGLVAALAAMLVHLARPSQPLTVFRLAPIPLIWIGLASALLAGLPGLWVRSSYMAAVWGGSLSLPIVGKIKIGTPLLFDIGVYLVVAGITLLLYQRVERWHAIHAQTRPTT